MTLESSYILIFCFLVLASVIIFIGKARKQKEWKKFLIGNIAILLLCVILFYLRQSSVVVHIFADWFPLLLIFFFYQMAGLLSRSFHVGTFDDPIIRLEKKIFRFYYPCMELSETFNFYWLSEFLHLCYCSYFFLIYDIPLYFYLRHHDVAFYRFEFAELLLLLSAFLTHSIVPVLSPRTIFAKIQAPLCDGKIYRMTHHLVQKGSAAGTAFPSVHVAMGVLVVLFSCHMHTLFFYGIALVALGLIISTIYGRFHYMMDLLFGVLYGCAVFMIVYG